MALSVDSVTAAMSTRRAQMDIAKLVASKHEVEVVSNLTHLRVCVHGPTGTGYAGGTWTVSVLLTTEYPYKAPLMRFSNKIFHPNVEYASGIVCMNEIQDAWSPLYDLLNIFDNFLPQLFRSPNTASPLNHLAASLLTKSPNKFRERVRQCVRMYAAASRPKICNRTRESAALESNLTASLQAESKI